jgi:hypothetical protein
MVFCPGTATDDIVAHELTHGVTDFTANLIYRNQSGQLNESFSDVFGELIDLFNGDAAYAGEPVGPPWPVHPTGPGQDAPNNLRTECSSADTGYTDGVRWLMGEDAAVFGGAIRDMWDPTCFGDPDFAYSHLQDCDIVDNGGVHSGSGIPNHAFALLTDGGTFNGHTVSGIGPIKAGAVWFRALTTYLTVASDFEDAYAAFNQAASDLIGTFPNDPRTGAPSGDMFSAADALEVDRALLAVEMNTPGSCGWTVEILDPDPPNQCTARTVIFADDFEGGDTGWTVSTTGPSGPPTPYDWARTTDPLPFGRPGVAWYCENDNLGDCDGQDESARHSLFSPPIAVPAEAEFPFVAFAHYMESEPAWDGGNLSIRVNGGGWLVIPSDTFEFNPYNSLLRGDFYSNTNPLAGQEAWTGVGGKWGTSVVDLRRFVGPGDTVEFRFDFGKDGCSGYRGWYLDDFAFYTCPDCNQNGTPDHREFVFTAASGPLFRIGNGASPSFTLLAPPPAAGDVLLKLTAMGDFSSQSESVAVYLNGMPLGSVFDQGGSDCPATPNVDTITVPGVVFNSAIGGGHAVIDMIAAENVNPALCGDGTYVTVYLSYDLSRTDDDGNGVPDECEDCSAAAPPYEEPQAAPKGRYLSFAPGNPGRHTALRVTLVDAPEPFEVYEGTQMWAGGPFPVSEISGLAGSGAPEFTAARLACEPVFADWGSAGIVYLFDEGVVPDATYEIQEVDLACGELDEQYYSGPLTLLTSRWGDVVGDCEVTPCTPPDGVVDFVDVSAVVAKFSNDPGAPIKARADVAPDVPDGIIDFVDIAFVVDAFRGATYPFDGPELCPESDSLIEYWGQPRPKSSSP